MIERHLGVVCFSPLDVVLDEETGLVVQPDLMFISTERSAILRDRVWGASDLVVEVASSSSEHRDRTLKLSWYKRYGVRECWLVYPKDQRIDVVDCPSEAKETFAGAAVVRSRVLPELSLRAEQCF